MVAVAIYVAGAASAPFFKSPAPHKNRLIPRMEGDEEGSARGNQGTWDEDDKDWLYGVHGIDPNKPNAKELLDYALKHPFGRPSESSSNDGESSSDDDPSSNKAEVHKSFHEPTEGDSKFGQQETPKGKQKQKAKTSEQEEMERETKEEAKQRKRSEKRVRHHYENMKIGISGNPAKIKKDKAYLRLFDEEAIDNLVPEHKDISDYSRVQGRLQADAARNKKGYIRVPYEVWKANRNREAKDARKRKGYEGVVT